MLKYLTSREIASSKLNVDGLFKSTVFEIFLIWENQQKPGKCTTEK